jgi:hypothetical protein
MYTRTRDVHPYWYTGYHGRPACCRLETWGEHGTPPVLLLTELPEHPGTSVTNRIEVLAAQAVARYFPQLLEALEETPFHVIERYPPTRHRDDRRERLAFVTFPSRAPRTMWWVGPHAQPTRGMPVWRHVRRADLEALLGCPYPEPEHMDLLGRPIPGE